MKAALIVGFCAVLGGAKITWMTGADPLPYGIACMPDEKAYMVDYYGDGTPRVIRSEKFDSRCKKEN